MCYPKLQMQVQPIQGIVDGEGNNLHIRHNNNTFAHQKSNFLLKCMCNL